MHTTSMHHHTPNVPCSQLPEGPTWSLNCVAACPAQALAARRVLSAPLVISPGLEDTEALVPGDPAPSLLGWIDIQDILRYFLKRESTCWC